MNMHLSYDKDGDGFWFRIFDNAEKEIGEAFVSLSSTSLYWDLKTVCIFEAKNRGQGYGSDLLKYVREQLWANQKLPIRTHAGISLDSIESGITAEE
jgi:hypothetical protein